MTTAIRRGVVIVGCVVALLTVLAVALPTTSRIVESTWHGTHDLPADLTTLTLDADAGDITIRAAGPGETPGAEVTIRAGLTDPDVTSEVTAGRAELTSGCPNWWWDHCRVDWEIVVPADTELDINNSVGEITVTETSGPLNLSTNVGGITADGIASPTVRADGSVGDISLDFSASPDSVEVSASTGDVSVTVPDDGTAYRVQTDASLGEVHSSLGSDPAGTQLIDVRTSVGDIILRRD